MVTSLFNKAMPLIRYEVGDIGVIRRSSNHINSELVELKGRLNDTIYLPSGKTVPGFTLYYVSRQILEESGIMKEYLIKQYSLDHFVFEVVSDSKILEKDITKIIKTAEEYLEPGLRIEVVQVDKIIKKGSGKHKHFYSLLENDEK